MDRGRRRGSIYFQHWQQLPNAASGLSLLGPPSPLLPLLYTFPTQSRHRQFHKGIPSYICFCVSSEKTKIKTPYALLNFKKKKIFFLSFLSSSQIRRCQNPKKVCECIIPAVCSKRGRESGKGRKPASHQVTHPGKSTLMISQCYKESTDCMYPSTSEGEEHILYAQYRQVTHSVTAAWVRLCYNVCLLQIKGH